jgi:hypothetical protein
MSVFLGFLLPGQRIRPGLKSPTMNHHFKEKASMKNFIRSAANWKLVVPVLFLGFVFAATAAQAQLGLEGPTGIYVTPLAYTAASPSHSLGRPVIAYHFLALGSTVGDYSSFSVTEGFAKRYELGYTSMMHSGKSFVGSDGWSPLVFGNGLARGSITTNHDFSIIHGKATIISENSFGTKWIPAIASAPVTTLIYDIAADTDARNTAQNTRNGDIYLVGSKTITQICKHVPVLISGGLRGTDASLWGLAGNAPNMTVRGFGSLALVFHGPSKSTIIVGSEVSQQPQQVKLGQVAVPTALVDIPTSETYAVRIIPSPRYKFNIDAAVLHASTSTSINNDYLPLYGPSRGLNVNDRVVFGVSYPF